MKEKKTVIFIESGVSGGGSFNSLYQYLLHCDHFKSVVIFFNKTHYIEKLEKINIPVYLINSTFHSNSKTLKLYMFLIVRKLCVLFSVKYAINIEKLFLSKVTKNINQIAHKYNSSIIIMNDQINRDFYGAFLSKTNTVISYLRSYVSTIMYKNNKLFLSRMRYANNAISFYIANSKVTMEHWRDVGIDHNIKLIYNAIGTLKIDSIVDFREELNIQNEPYIIGIVGSFVEYKGHEFLVRSAAGLMKDNPRIHLVLIGDGILKDHLISIVSDLEIKQNVHFLGYKKNIYDYIAGLDLLVVPSSKESFGRVVLEAHQLNVPVVASNIGGLAEIIENNHNGLLVEYNNTDELTAAILKCMNDPELVKNMITNGKSIVTKKYNIDTYCKLFNKYVDKVIKQTS